MQNFQSALTCFLSKLPNLSDDCPRPFGYISGRNNPLTHGINMHKFKLLNVTENVAFSVLKKSPDNPFSTLPAALFQWLN